MTAVPICVFMWPVGPIPGHLASASLPYGPLLCSTCAEARPVVSAAACVTVSHWTDGTLEGQDCVMCDYYHC